MCTLIVVRSPGRLRVAANRDERLGRPARPPTRWTPNGRVAVAPVDAQAGGTWIGVNDRGVFAGITNRFGVPGWPGAPSRGRWVPRMLAAASAAEAVRPLAAETVRENGFHLVVADLVDAFELVHDGEKLEMRPLPEGVTVLTERSRGAAPAPREALIVTLLAELGTDRDALATVLDHADPEHPLDGVRVHAPDLDYGTRSSALIEIDDGGLRFEHAERYPSVTPYEDYASALEVGSNPDAEGR